MTRNKMAMANRSRRLINLTIGYISLDLERNIEISPTFLNFYNNNNNNNSGCAGPFGLLYSKIK